MFSLPQLPIPAIAFPKFGLGADSSRITKVAAPVGAIVVSLLIFAFIVWPKFNEVLRLRSSNAQLSARADSLEQKATVLASLDRDVLDSQLGSAEALLPSDKGVFLVVAQIERAAALSGVILNKVDVTPGGIGPSAGATDAQQAGAATAGTPTGAAADLSGQTFDTPKVQLKVSITGDYAAVLRFLSAIAALPRVISVADLALSSASSGQEGGGSALRALLSLDAYWMPIPSELPSVETPVEDLSSSEVQRLDYVRSAEATGGGAVVLPQVPTGKGDIFAPF